MRVKLVDLDSKMPNLALMQLSSYHKSLNDVVGFDINDPDKVYISCIFKDNASQDTKPTVTELYICSQLLKYQSPKLLMKVHAEELFDKLIEEKLLPIDEADFEKAEDLAAIKRFQYYLKKRESIKPDWFEE